MKNKKKELVFTFEFSVEPENCYLSEVIDKMKEYGEVIIIDLKVVEKSNEKTIQSNLSNNVLF